MRVLLVGAAGTIGSHVRQSLKKRGHQLIPSDSRKPTDGDSDRIEAYFACMELDRLPRGINAVAHAEQANEVQDRFVLDLICVKETPGIIPMPLEVGFRRKESAIREIGQT